jgi:hypothetical protein
MDFEKFEQYGGRGEEDMFKSDARLPVTQSDDPRSGGHFALGASKAPPGSARERSGIIVHIVGALKVANSKDGGFVSVARKRSPISNGLTTVGGAKTRLL